VSYLADALTNFTWTSCQAFELAGYVFANDATSPDGAQEYAVLRNRNGEFVQIESITFSWCSEAQATALIERALAGQFDGNHFGVVAACRFQTPDVHGSCQFCS
jgi:hypothetical protein